MASTEKAKNKADRKNTDRKNTKNTDDRPNLGPKPGPKSKRIKPVGSKKRKKGSHWRSTEVESENVGKNPKMESDDSEVEIPDDLTDYPVEILKLPPPKTKSLKVRVQSLIFGQN